MKNESHFLKKKTPFVLTIIYVQGTTSAKLTKFELRNSNFLLSKQSLNIAFFFDLQALLSIEFLCQESENNNNDL